MADASTIISHLGQQIAQLVVDKAILQTELDELRADSVVDNPQEDKTT